MKLKELLHKITDAILGLFIKVKPTVDDAVDTVTDTFKEETSNALEAIKPLAEDAVISLIDRNDVNGTEKRTLAYEAVRQGAIQIGVQIAKNLIYFAIEKAYATLKDRLN